ncbi:hypothetical protein PIB30_067328 [Stylosanthes scabra]|uniref:Uncharacterized protein n=1 Tax=Stylosanthes scabra TaxID=79078 RepID=A0ABU6UN60_9FABA|nr:hypothetical protein [Stylosanthes scabra]
MPTWAYFDWWQEACRHRYLSPQDALDDPRLDDILDDVPLTVSQPRDTLTLPADVPFPRRRGTSIFRTSLHKHPNKLCKQKEGTSGELPIDFAFWAPPRTQLLHPCCTQPQHTPSTDPPHAWYQGPAAEKKLGTSSRLGIDSGAGRTSGGPPIEVFRISSSSSVRSHDDFSSESESTITCSPTWLRHPMWQHWLERGPSVKQTDENHWILPPDEPLHKTPCIYLA